MLTYLFSNDKVRLKWSDVIIAMLFFVFGLFVFAQMYRIQVDMFWHLRSMTIVVFDKGRLFKPSYDAMTRIASFFLGFCSSLILTKINLQSSPKAVGGERRPPPHSVLWHFLMAAIKSSRATG